MVTVDIAAAIICFASQCYPALIGSDTPRGEFTLTQRYVLSPGYGGDVMQFKEGTDVVYAVHRVWLGNPKERRLERLASPDPKQRKVTRGCVNVSNEVYDMIVNCCQGSSILIK